MRSSLLSCDSNLINKRVFGHSFKILAQTRRVSIEFFVSVLSAANIMGLCPKTKLSGRIASVDDIFLYNKKHFGR